MDRITNILIMGASGAGSTTLGKALEGKTGFKFLDVDDYYWEKTDPPYQKKISSLIRKENLLNDFHAYKKTIVSGSLVSWGDSWINAFDLVIFIRIKPAIRMKRLMDREIDRYGNSSLKTDPIIQKTSSEFIEWARKYDDPNFKGRSVKVHQEWLKKLKCDVFDIDGTLPLEEKVDIVLSKIEDLNS